MKTDQNDSQEYTEPEADAMQEASGEEDVPDETQKKFNLLAEIRSYLLIFVTAFAAAFLLNHFVIVNARVPTGSMLDTIQLKNRLIGSRLTYLFSEPKRGDIVMFKWPDDPTGKTIFIKRIIGLPGETITITDGYVYINDSDTPLAEPYLKSDAYPDDRDFGPFEVPEGCYFMLGDNRKNSKDSRYWVHTYVPKGDILGKALFIYFPFSDAKWLGNEIYY